MIDLDPRWDRNKRQDETATVTALIAQADLDATARQAITARAAKLVSRIRTDAAPGLMEVFLAEYGLSTDEGIALMCLAEALLRVPDSVTIDALIEDKIAPSDWGKHLGHSASPLVNASTWGLMLTGRVLKTDAPGIAGHLRHAVKRLGEPVIRTAVGRAMREMGRQFVLGQDITAAMDRAKGQEAKGYTYSYDMLGEAAMTQEDAERYTVSYASAIKAIAKGCTRSDIRSNPGISVKLSALHPRYEVAKTDRVIKELVPVLRDLARQAAKAGMGFNIDAEEADRLGLSLKVIEAVLCDPELAGWDGFGVVVQAYGRRASDVLDGLYELVDRLDRRIMVRLVKGAYWDTEIKHAQVEGLTDFPVFSRKSATDVSYIANARKLLRMTDRIYPQFATHNAHTVAAVLEMAADLPRDAFEFQRLHGMGEALHGLVLRDEATKCRIYAPVGAHRDLLAYLVRRLLENGANSSFVNQIVDEDIPAETVAACPFAQLDRELAAGGPGIATGPNLFEPERRNSVGFDLFDVTELSRIDTARDTDHPTCAEPLLAGPLLGTAPVRAKNPATGDVIGKVVTATAKDVETALATAKPWATPAAKRAETLRQVADLYEQNFGDIFALLAREAGKTLIDAVGELREAVDFLRYYAVQAEKLDHPARGVFTCISPWNFPLAIFTGQIAAALAAGNGVLAKPAETTPMIASFAVRLMHKAGIPAAALQLVPGEGRVVGRALTSDPRISGVAFTGSTATARQIQAAMAANLTPGAPLIAETGGLNAMIVDSTALPEQAVRDIVASAFQSAGQRCSALRCLYVQEDIEPAFRKMLIGAMNELALGDPWALETDIGPVITETARADIDTYIANAQKSGRLLHALATPTRGNFVAPTLIRVNGIADLDREIFGPVLHLATFKASEVDKVIADVNATGYGLTFGLHTRIDTRVQDIADSVHAGNIYVNRNQIGAIVGSQPFGGEGLSGTGPKAGGPNYLPRFTADKVDRVAAQTGKQTDRQQLETAIKAAQTDCAKLAKRQIDMPGPTGEMNRLTLTARGPVLCLGPGQDAAKAQAARIGALGGAAVSFGSDTVPADLLRDIAGIAGVVWWGDAETATAYAAALADRSGPLTALITDMPDTGHAVHERHLCVDTTAAGGNASLLAGLETV
ncbi:Bifunctional protein PutA [Thalassovita gelatinovora]|uniref:Bifunctional protein PutA n=1 Tax=Thalassovita gelatinovora TaxID=53501 RepID=A0A0P1FK10_THAGE|nr:bifunctional proline dehydrogenase/L-glutamate gamma-semialdehyde dehydrogenase PutA [Thalassovita gelatinovora]QIZ82319.1 bifunctional proline dehydrogenase/L-glutamate gamma-semialdehyde dehydrogenase PutA [Thalassovita gelatinovora]CUH68371.1 Bifunctional protein PutA [Thalassovita gelatinovora]SER19194.1 L-proline dehydrogenase /delta-1-pyrroline-5-carboxylate dehydrogenase [Thalassovita gelatinovora]